MTSRLFDLGDILSITTGKLLSPRLIEGVYDILDFMTGDNLQTLALGSAAEECKPVLFEQHPALQSIDVNSITSDNWQQELQNLYDKYGKELPVEPLAKDQHKSLTISEMLEKYNIPSEKVIGVILPE